MVSPNQSQTTKCNSVAPKITSKMNNSHSMILLTLTFLLFLHSSIELPHHSMLVYKNCATKTFNKKLSQTYPQTLNSLFQQLIAHSSQHKFFKTIETLSHDTTISGLYQCRDDISKEDCFSCVNTLPHISNTLCSDSMSARVQLHGCYIHYETGKLREETDGEGYKSRVLLHKECEEAVEDYVKFKELMEEAFGTLESGILNSDGYYATNYKSVKLMAQCEGDSDTCECSNCVSDAVQVAKEECATSLSAQIYLDKCFISYGIFGHSLSGEKRNNNTEKLAAIIVGGAAALFLGFVLLSLINSRFRKDDYE